MNFTVTMTGFEAIDRVLTQLPKELSHEVMGKAHLQAAKIVVEKEKLLAPEGPTGNLVDSIGAYRVPFKKADVVGEVIAGPQRGRGKRGHAGHLVEFGTRKRDRTGPNRGIMKARPFARPAFNATHPQMKNAIIVATAKVLNNTMRRYLR